jgi:hypothetical protein
MMPYSEICIGDMFSNPLHRGCGKYSGLEWVVMEKKEGMIKVQGVSFATGECMGSAIWKKPSDRMFSENWRVFSNSTAHRGKGE